MKDKVDELMLDYNILPGYKGYDYIRYAIQLNMQEYNMSQLKITQSIYPKIAKEFNTESSRVERAIRHLISKSNLKGYSNKTALARLQLEYSGVKDNEQV